jgi:hypothetical protein
VLYLVSVSHADASLQLAVMMVPTCSPASQIARDEAIHDLHFADVACRCQKIEHRELEDRAAARRGRAQPRSLTVLAQKMLQRCSPVYEQQFASHPRRRANIDV